MKTTIDGVLFKQMVLHGAAAIALQKQKINDLNVFPVPDGDTGTNMSMTIDTAAAELRKGTPASVGEASKITASALLRGARGNSGVILSLLFRGISKALKGLDEADGKTFAAAMQEGVAAAYSAVMKPAEGTVLTVSRLAAKRAVEAAATQNSAQYALEEAIKTGYEVLPQTTEMNPVLKKANVVDAGAKGYLVILEGMLAAMRGEPMPEVSEAGQEKADFAALGEEAITFTFDTVFIVRKTTNKPLEGLRAYLSSIGDSLVIGEDDEAFKVHVHTDIPGARPHRGSEVRHPWSWPRSRTCAPRRGSGRRTAGPEHRRSGRRGAGTGGGRVPPSPPRPVWVPLRLRRGRHCPPCSGIWGWTASSPAVQTMRIPPPRASSTRSTAPPRGGGIRPGPTTRTLSWLPSSAWGWRRAGRSLLFPPPPFPRASPP